MKVRANHWLKHGGTWHKGGDVFDINPAEAAELRGMIEIAEAPVLTTEPEAPQEQPKRRGRRTKAEAAE